MPRKPFEYLTIALIISGLVVPQSDLKIWALAVSAAIGAELLEHFRDKIGA